MNPDDEICICFHVSLRKLVNFARREKPKAPARMSECLGAGTGCGWCIPVLCKIAASAQRPDLFRFDLSAEDYAAARAKYREEKREKNRFEGPDAE